MNHFKKLMAAAALASSSVLAQAADDTFIGLTYGKTDNKITKSSQLDKNLDNPNVNGVIGSEGTWGLRLGQQNDVGRYYVTYDNVSGSHNGVRLRQENLLGSYDLFFPAATGTKLFLGGSAGTTKLSQESKGYSRDTNYGYAFGVQAGLLQQVSDNMSMELGYRYLRTNASVEMVPHGARKAGSMDLSSTGQMYVSANYAF
ncbi:hypothetical protein [Pseudomonas sp. nanlin1]|uniref:hypothetical protein n=1 Tax=Pseudomonas sp. nanlin1 TaxID=3040605 RepID=UPI0038907C60